MSTTETTETAAPIVYEVRKSAVGGFGPLRILWIAFIIIIIILVYVIYRALVVGPGAGYACRPWYLTFYGLLPTCAPELGCNAGVCSKKSNNGSLCTSDSGCSNGICGLDGAGNGESICCPGNKKTLYNAKYFCDNVPLNGKCYDDGTSYAFCTGGTVCAGYDTKSDTSGRCLEPGTAPEGTICHGGNGDPICESGQCGRWSSAATERVHRCCSFPGRTYSWGCAEWYCDRSTPSGQKCVLNEQCASGICIDGHSSRCGDGVCA